MTRHFVDQNGVYLGGWDWSALYEGADNSACCPPEGAVEVPVAPLDARQVWDGEKWGPVPVSNEEHRKYLNETDWYVIRFQETGEPIPEEISIKRAEARAAITD